jgi:dynein heavy chain 1
MPLAADAEVDAAEDEGTEVRPPFEVKTEMEYGGPAQAVVIFTKRADGGVLTQPADDATVSAQLLTMAFGEVGEGSPYAMMQMYLRSAIGPFIKDTVEKQQRTDLAGKRTLKAIADLDNQLTQIQQNTDMPKIHLAVHPKVMATWERIRTQGRDATVADFGEQVRDPKFLNELQKGVSKWTREIQKLTHIQRDPTAGTAIQETTFWLNMKEALQDLTVTVEMPEVQLTLALLEAGNRTVAVVGFRTDTRLAERMSNVEEICTLFEEFPRAISKLQTAATVAEVTRATLNILAHFKKVRGNKSYKASRAQSLLEAIGRCSFSANPTPSHQHKSTPLHACLLLRSRRVGTRAKKGRGRLSLRLCGLFFFFLLLCNWGRKYPNVICLSAPVINVRSCWSL